MHVMHHHAALYGAHAVCAMHAFTQFVLNSTRPDTRVDVCAYTCLYTYVWVRALNATMHVPGYPGKRKEMRIEGVEFTSKLLAGWIGHLGMGQQQDCRGV